MRISITLACVGKLGQGPEKTLCDRYLKRLPWPCTIKEFPESRAGSVAARKSDEADKLARACLPCQRVLALDETGTPDSSEQLQRRLAHWGSDGTFSLGIMIGGPDGLDPGLRAKAHGVLSLGHLTWPHKLVRVLILEQLYRQWSMAAGHPYHRD